MKPLQMRWVPVLRPPACHVTEGWEDGAKMKPLGEAAW